MFLLEMNREAFCGKATDALDLYYGKALVILHTPVYSFAYLHFVGSMDRESSQQFQM